MQLKVNTAKRVCFESTFPIIPEKAHWKKLHGKSSSKNSKRQNLPSYTRKNAEAKKSNFNKIVSRESN